MLARIDVKNTPNTYDTEKRKHILPARRRGREKDSKVLIVHARCEFGRKSEGRPEMIPICVERNWQKKKLGREDDGTREAKQNLIVLKAARSRC